MMIIIIIIWPFRSQFGLKLKGGRWAGLSPGSAIAVGWLLSGGQVLQNQLPHPVDSGLCGGWRYPPYLQFELT